MDWIAVGSLIAIGLTALAGLATSWVAWMTANNVRKSLSLQEAEAAKSRLNDDIRLMMMDNWRLMLPELSRYMANKEKS